MFRSLRSRLLLSYTAVITITLLVVALALFGFAALTNVRTFPTLQRLAAISQANRIQLQRLREAGAEAETIERVLRQTAEDSGVRILVANRRRHRVIYDSHGGADSWVDVNIAGIVQPDRTVTGLEPGSIFGRFRHPNGTRWLVYASPQFDSRVMVFYAQQEPTPLAFFRENFAQPLQRAGIVAFLLSIPLAFIIARSVARPLQRMAQATDAVAEGDYNPQLPLEGPEEVQQLAANFNNMAAQVKATNQAQRDFVANVSHDLKTPITSIQGWSQALLDGTAVSPNAQKQAAAVIHDEASRMARLVNQLLDLARIESGQLQLSWETVDLHQLLQQVVRSLRLHADTVEVNLRWDVPPLPPLIGDHDRLTQVFHNLVDNAISHTPPGGRVTIRGQVEGDVVTIAVADTGSGIPAEELPRIFERFYQVDKSRSRENGRHDGAGLGLAIVRELVEAHNGRINTTSRPGEGSVFTVRLPLRQ